MAGAATSYTDILEPGETLRWQGKVGFNITSSPVLTAGLVLFALYMLVGLWIMQTPATFCDGAGEDSPCGTLYWATPPLALLMAAMQGFEMLERRAILSGQAQAVVLLTDRRLIRVSDWPWRRVRSHSYQMRLPRRGIGGVLRFGALGGTVILSPADAKHVRDLMRLPARLSA